MSMLTMLGIFCAVLVLLFLIRRRVSLFWTTTLFFIATTGYVLYGFEPALPMSVVVLYVGTLLIALLLYVTSSDDGKEAFFRPIMSMILNNKLAPVRLLFLVAVPGLIGWQSYQMVLPSDVAPPRIRQVHPPPPDKVAFSGPEYGQYDETNEDGTPLEGVKPNGPNEIDMVTADNPLRKLEKSNSEQFRKHVANGKTIYYQNCYYCHGDHLMADGHYADAVNPRPANFQDPGVLPMLQESFLFWRLAKGGPGLPDAGTPWDSSMPVWEKMLTEEEIWEVILFLYDHTGYQPRTREELH